jgi:hypothetical protein
MDKGWGSVMDFCIYESCLLVSMYVMVYEYVCVSVCM